MKDLICLRKLDILALSETWLRSRDDSDSYIIENYNFLRYDRASGSRGGGVALYINNAFLFSPIDLSIPLTNTSIDVVGAVIYLRRKRLAVIAVYRPPLASISDMHALELCLSGVFSRVDGFACLGDFNINYLNHLDSNVHHLNNIMLTFSLKQIIDSPTRISSVSASLLD